MKVMVNLFLPLPFSLFLAVELTEYMITPRRLDCYPSRQLLSAYPRIIHPGAAGRILIRINLSAGALLSHSYSDESPSCSKKSRGFEDIREWLIGRFEKIYPISVASNFRTERFQPMGPAPSA